MQSGTMCITLKGSVRRDERMWTESWRSNLHWSHHSTATETRGQSTRYIHSFLLYLTSCSFAQKNQLICESTFRQKHLSAVIRQKCFLTRHVRVSYNCFFLFRGILLLVFVEKYNLMGPKTHKKPPIILTKVFFREVFCTCAKTMFLFMHYCVA